MISAFVEKISLLLTKLALNTSKRTLKLKGKIIHEKLKMLHNEFLVAPIDNASGNVSIVYQNHYTQVLINELVWIMLLT